MDKIVAFGEIMLRIATPSFFRFRQALPGKMNTTFGGSEANVAASLAMFGKDVAYVTALPSHDISDACIDELRNLGVDTSYVIKTDPGRLGVYYVETGANQRPSKVIYDRSESAISKTSFEEYNFDELFQESIWLHISGITPALSSIAAHVSVAVAQAAKKANLTVSCDLNYRRKLWDWDTSMSSSALAKKTMHKILPYVDVLIANEEDCAEILGIHAKNTNVDGGKLNIELYPQVAEEVISLFPNISKVGITLRESISASHNNWGGMLYSAEDNKACFSPLEEGVYSSYRISDIVDRFGAGDSFAAGLIYALMSSDYDDQQDVLDFAVASSCLSHSIVGDYNYSTVDEVKQLLGGCKTGRIMR